MKKKKKRKETRVYIAYIGKYPRRGKGGARLSMKDTETQMEIEECGRNQRVLHVCVQYAWKLKEDKKRMAFFAIRVACNFDRKTVKTR